MRAPRPLAACLALAVAAWLAPAAAAGTVRLKSGKQLAAEEVRFLAGRLEVTLRLDGGTARIEVPFERVEPRALLALWDLAHDPVDGAQRLASARLAEDLGLRGEAALRYHEAAALEPQLAEVCDAGLAALRVFAAAEALVALEAGLRRGEAPADLLARAEALEAGPHAGFLSGAQAQRVRVLTAMARQRLARDVRRAAEAAAPVAAPPVPGPPAAADPLLARVEVHEAQARAAREAAADPALPAARALRHLETAARALLDARRVVRDAPAARAAALAETGERLRRVLVHTYLELADLLRLEQRFDEAQAHVRAVALLDPGNEDAAAQRLQIAADLRSLQSLEPYRAAFEETWWSPSPYAAFGAHWGLPGCGPLALRGGSTYVRFPLHPGRHGGSTVHRVTGRRR